MAKDFADIQACFTVLIFCVAFLLSAEGQEGAVLKPDLKADACKMIVEMCTNLYSRKLKEENGSDKELCATLHAYELCLERSASTCEGDRSFDTLITVLSRLLHRLCLEHKDSSKFAKHSLPV